MVSIWRENVLRYLSADITCSEKRTVNCELRGTDNVQGQRLSIFSPQMETTVLIIILIFFATRRVLKIGEYLTTIHRSGGG